MTAALPARRALSDLPVNAPVAPAMMDKMNKLQTGQKRSYWQMSVKEVPNGSAKGDIDPHDPAGEKSKRKAFTAPQATPPYSPVTDPPSSQEDPPTDHTSSKDSAPSTPNGSELDSTTISQQTAATEVTQPPRSRASQHLETLRLRLQLARFKIRTNQVDVPFHQLRMTTEEQRDSRLPKAALEEDEGEQGASRTPTTRRIDAEMATPPQLPSSPPLSSSRSPVRRLIQDEEEFRTPALPRRRVILEDDDGSERPGGSRRGERDNGLTSSAIKGSAAISLLGLRNQQS
ncbi:MAG: hypothetical protein OHK93_005944 [Ramalina farinacea]|uniref:Uncharacterized protein n=1 Tax=Ramalina farinacea TaxID=258253 RepID=A0AA43QJA3_9LECA|nr:hypothetical protein [Ramalina farinacea]